MPVAQQDQPLAGSLEEAQQRYETTKKALKAGITKKRQIDRALTDLESQIFLFEGSYLASTAASGGNIVKGFEGYLKSAATGGHGPKSASAHVTLTPNDIPVEDRMFSASSATYTRSLQLKANEGRSREQSPATNGSTGGGGASSSKKGEKSSGGEKGDKSGEKSGKSSKKEKAAAKEDGGDVSVEKKSANGGGESTSTPSKKQKREKEASGSVNGSTKKKRKDDD